MNRTLRNIFATGVTVLTLTGATAMQANAAYMGYGNGDPGNWDFWQEQRGGATAPGATATTKPTHHASAHHQHHVAKPNAAKPTTKQY